MFHGFSPATVDFLWQLRLNNEKAWFEAHREDFKRDLQQPMKELGAEVFGRMSEKYPNHGFIHKLSRIYKDARRLRGMGPYRDAMWFSIEKPSEEWTSVPVFWFELTPESWTNGMGYYQARPETMAKLRARIDRDPKKFERLIAPLEKQDEFSISGDEYVRKKPAPTEKTALWYNKKTFFLAHTQPNGEELFSPKLAERIFEGMQFLMPIYEYIVTLDSDPSPKA